MCVWIGWISMSCPHRQVKKTGILENTLKYRYSKYISPRSPSQGQLPPSTTKTMRHVGTEQLITAGLFVWCYRWRLIPSCLWVSCPLICSKKTWEMGLLRLANNTSKHQRGHEQVLGEPTNLKFLFFSWSSGVLVVESCFTWTPSTVGWIDVWTFEDFLDAVSYTHLTLPTKLEV